MENVCVYPGTFCPPHYGHLEIVKKAACIFGKVYVVCSFNPDKDGNVIFTPDECKEMWHAYELPCGVEVVTFDEFMERGIDFKSVVMVRGVRDDKDFEYEKKVMMGNNRELGIDKFFVMVSDKKFGNVSSTAVRKMVDEGDMERLKGFVSDPVAQKMIGKMK